MKKKNTIFIFVALLSLFFNSFVLAEAEEEKVDLTKSPAYMLKGYNNCSIPNEYTDYITISVNGGDSTIIKNNDPVGSGRINFEITCKNALYPEVTKKFKVIMKTVSQSESEDDSKYLDLELPIYVSRTLTMYKSCAFADKDEGYITIDNKDNGVYINVKKAGKSVELNCITKQGNNAKLHLKTSFYANSSSTSNRVEFKKGQGTTTTLSGYEYCFVNNDDPYVRPVQYNAAGTGVIGLYVRKAYSGKETSYVTEKLSCSKKSNGALEELSVAIYGGVTATEQTQIDSFYVNDVNLTINDIQKTINLYNFKNCTLKNSSSNGNLTLSSSNYHAIANINGAGTYNLSCSPYDTATTQNVNITVNASQKFENGNTSNNSNVEKEDVGNNCTSIFGDIKDDGKTYDPDGNRLPSVAYVLQAVFNFMQFLGPLLVISLTVMDAVKAVASGDKDALNKLLKTTTKRIIYAVILFVFPTVLKEILSWITTSDPTCGIM